MKINVGEAHVALGECERAIPELEEAAAICRAAGERRLLCDAIVALGAARARTGDVESGIELIREAIALRTEIKAARTLPNDYCFLIEALLEAGRNEEAATGAAELQKLYQAAPDGQMFPTYILATLARARRGEAGGSAASSAKRFLAEGKAPLEARAWTNCRTMQRARPTRRLRLSGVFRRSSLAARRRDPSASGSEPDTPRAGALAPSVDRNFVAVLQERARFAVR